MKDPIFFKVREELGSEVSSVEEFREALVEKLVEAAKASTAVVLDTRGAYGFNTRFINAAFGEELTAEFNRRAPHHGSVADYIRGVLPIGAITTLLIKNKIKTGDLAPKITSDMF